MQKSKDISIWKNIDWVTVLLYTVLVFFGWVSIYAASYDYDYASIFDFAERSGKQLLWIGLSFMLAFVILMYDNRFYETYAYLIYGLLILLLLVTIVIAPEIKGSRSWIVLGPLSLQPAEFAKFATALALARFMDSYNFVLTDSKNIFKASMIVLLPMMLIMLQKETGSALVYASLILVFYREGISGLILFGVFCAILYFVLALKFSDMTFGAYTPMGEFIVLIAIILIMIGMVIVYVRKGREARNIGLGTLIVAAIITTLYYFDIDINYLYLLLAVIVAIICYLIIIYLQSRIHKVFVIVGFALASVAFLFSVNYAFHDILEPHQQMRIKVALGMEDDLRGAGYNVNQSKIAIGSGGFLGKGFLNGTQTKLKYVPEQDTDFIFCTIGEEEGFVGSTLVIVLFLTLILRLIYIAERQRSTFGRVYAYCVVSILFFHLAINVGMVIGLCPVIGIPLPFFSYGGSSLWGFTLLLFILLRIDMGRLEKY